MSDNPAGAGGQDDAARPSNSPSDLMKEIVREGYTVRFREKRFVKDFLHALCCEVEELSFVTVLSKSYRETGELRTQPQLRGKVRLTQGPIVVVGDDYPDRYQRLLRLLIRRRDKTLDAETSEAERLRALASDEIQSSETSAAEAADALMRRDTLTAHDVRMFLSFEPGNQELGLERELWMELQAPPEVFDALVAEYQSNRLTRLSLHLKTSLWINKDEYHSLASAPVDWHLFPDRVNRDPISGDTFSYEMAWGYAQILVAERAAVALGPAATEKSEPAPEPEDPRPPAPMAHTADAHSEVAFATVAALLREQRDLTASIARGLWFVGTAIIVSALILWATR